MLQGFRWGVAGGLVQPVCFVSRDPGSPHPHHIYPGSIPGVFVFLTAPPRRPSQISISVLEEQEVFNQLPPPFHVGYNLLIGHCSVPFIYSFPVIWLINFHWWALMSAKQQRASYIIHHHIHSVTCKPIFQSRRRHRRLSWLLRNNLSADANISASWSGSCSCASEQDTVANTDPAAGCWRAGDREEALLLRADNAVIGTLCSRCHIAVSRCRLQTRTWPVMAVQGMGLPQYC